MNEKRTALCANCGATIIAHMATDPEFAEQQRRIRRRADRRYRARQTH